ncbi:MAG: hypothetical protein KDC98_24965 [Planctomycetes bacterium]|nr:hypothetical protein [Planctomycetota bacterium]
MNAPRTALGERSPAFGAGRPRWWQWPTILSLDAPIVAVCWQWMLAAVVAVRLQWHHAVLLAAMTWLVYAADRWIEGFLLAPGQVRTWRHWFYQRWRWHCLAAWLVVAAAGLVVAATRLSRAEGMAGAVLSVPVLVYLLSHQLVHRRHPWRLPKEILIAVLFALGTACLAYLHAEAAPERLVAPLLLFALLCFANCALIAVWETEVDRCHAQTSLVLQFPRSRGPLRALPWAIAAAAAWLAWQQDGAPRIAAGCAAASGLLLGALDLGHQRCGRQLARVLADVALMTPLLPWCLGDGSGP